jgi:predicted GNAT family N-acyltransferase
MSYKTEPLSSSHKKKNFACGKTLLDNYLHTQAKQDMKRKLSVCFILADDQNNVKGYYTLSNASIQRDWLSDEIRAKLPPSYANLPTTLLGRLAIDNAYKGNGLGATLLIDALKRAYDTSVTSIGSMAVVVDPIDDDATKFYLKYGFIKLPDSGKMFLPMETISQLFKDA